MADNEIIEKLTTARVGLLLRHPFFGNIATRMRLIESDDWCPTAATDGRNFYYNNEFVRSLSIKKLEFLFAHEIGHCIFDHIGRRGNRDHRLANIAQDYAINQILVDDRIGERITEVEICQDNQYRDMAWEEIYDQLYEQAQKISIDELLEQLGDVLDEHLDQGGSGDNDKAGCAPTIDPGELENIRNEIKQSMIQAAQAAGAGNIPRGVQRLIKDLTEPKMDWREVLRMNIQSVVRHDYSWQRFNRKSAHTGAVLPGMLNDQKIQIAVAIDMSGSISNDDAAAFLSEVKGILDQYQDYDIDLWCFDTDVHNHVHITQDDSHAFDSYEPAGGGGTEFDVNWTHMRDNDIQPKKFIMFTDGYPWGSWGDPDWCDTLFIVKGNKEACAPFGDTVIYENLV